MVAEIVLVGIMTPPSPNNNCVAVVDIGKSVLVTVR